MGALGAERHPRPDLATPPGERIGRDAGQADGGEHETEQTHTGELADSDAGMTRVYGETLGRLESMPATRSVGIVQRLPLEGHTFIETLSRMEDTRPILERPVANYRVVSPDCPQARGIAVTSGRMFTEDDRVRRPIVISERAARTRPCGRARTRSGGSSTAAASRRGRWRGRPTPG